MARVKARKDVISHESRDGVEKWFSDYLHWMTTSPKGLDEKKSGNNHATWWTAQAASYAALVGDKAAQKMCWLHSTSHGPFTGCNSGSTPATRAPTRCRNC